MPKLTVVIPTFDRPDYLAECLETVAAQTFRDFDLVVLDNASTADYAPVLERFASLDIEYVRNPENIGAIGNIAHAREIGSRSAYHIVFHDDDLMHPRMLGWQVGALEARPDLAWVATESLPFPDGTTPAFGKYVDPRTEVFESVDGLVRTLLENVPLNFGSVMFRSSAGKGTEFRREEFEIIADRVLLCDIAATSPVGLIREPLVLYRHHAAQDSHNPVFRERHALALMAYYERFLPHPLSAADRALLQRHATNYVLHARSAVAPENRIPFSQLVGQAKAEGLWRWSAIDGQGVAAMAHLAGLGGPYGAIRPALGRIKRSFSGR